jgi:hypothetical protein
MSVRRSIRSSLIAVGAVAATAGLVACSGLTGKPDATSLDVNVTIASGQCTPTNATFKVKMKLPITFHVTSDAKDEIHVHSDPDHKFKVKAAANQTFQFSIDHPGNVEVELHKLKVTIATIQVQQ